MIDLSQSLTPQSPVEAEEVEPSREEFETWVNTQTGFPIDRISKDGNYLAASTYAAWLAWQAALRSKKAQP